MPQTGLCADITCPQQLTPLYECHCCNCFICLNHLLEHVQIVKRNQERFESLRQELMSVASKLETLLQKKLQEIEHEKSLIQRATHLLGSPLHAIEDLQRICDEIKQAITNNANGKRTLFRSSDVDEPVLNVESSLLESQPSNNDNRMRLLPVSRTYSISTENYAERRSSAQINTKDKSTRSSVLDQITDDPSVSPVDHVKVETNNLIAIDEQLPIDSPALTVIQPENDRPFATRSIQLGSKDKSNKLSSFLTPKKNATNANENEDHSSPMINERDPNQQTLLDENEMIFHSRRKFPCPLSENMINLFGCPPKTSKRIPCHSKLVLGPSLLTHLSRYHNIRPRLAKPLVKRYQENLIKMTSTNDNALDSS